MASLRPASRFDWERVIRRANLPTSTKAVALLLATYADEDGTHVHPGEDRLARVAGMRPRMLRTHIAKLRKVGLLVLVSRADRFRGRADEHRLSVPEGEGLAALDLLDPNEAHRQLMTGEPVDNSGVTGNTVPVTGPDAPGGTRRSPATERTVTGNPVHESPAVDCPPPTHRPTTNQPTDLSSPSDVQSASTGDATTKTDSEVDQLAPLAADECSGGHGGRPGLMPDGMPWCAQCRAANRWRTA